MVVGPGRVLFAFLINFFAVVALWPALGFAAEGDCAQRLVARPGEAASALNRLDLILQMTRTAAAAVDPQPVHPYQRGDSILLGQSVNGDDITLLDEQGPIEFSLRTQFPATYWEPIDEQQISLVFQGVRYRGSLFDVDLPEDYLSPRLERILAAIPREEGSVRVGDWVRLRQNHLLQVAQVTGVNGTRATVDLMGKALEVPQQRLFRFLGGTPRSVQGRVGLQHGRQMQRDIFVLPPKGPLRAVLDGVARFTSLKDFSLISHRDQVLLLTQLTQIILPWSEEAFSIENRGLQDLSRIVRTGIGVCRHLAPLLATMLAETGFDHVLLVSAATPVEAHIWVEVKLGNEVLVADPSHHPPLVVSRTVLNNDPNVLVAPDMVQFYLNPEQTIEVLKPIPSTTTPR